MMPALAPDNSGVGAFFLAVMAVGIFGSAAAHHLRMDKQHKIQEATMRLEADLRKQDADRRKEALEAEHEVRKDLLNRYERLMMASNVARSMPQLQAPAGKPAVSVTADNSGYWAAKARRPAAKGVRIRRRYRRR